MKSTALWFVVALSLVATSLLAQEAVLGVEVSGGDELVREKGRFKETWVRPDADLSRFSKLHLVVGELQFREGAVTSVRTVGRIDDKSSFALSEQEQERYRQVVSEAFINELQRSKKLELVFAPGPDTLLVRASITDIASFIPPPSAARVEIYPSAVGEGVVHFELIDPETGVMLARLEERSRIRPPGQTMNEVSPMPVYRETMWKSIERWSSHAASDLRRALESAQNGGRLK